MRYARAMPGLIPSRFIDDLLSRIDILDVIEPRVKLRKTGKNYSGLCPFHQEKSPSFSVQPEKQFYYCFGCGAGGNALGFLMNFENLDFVDAVESLAKSIGVEVPREESGRSKQQDSRYDALLKILSDASAFYQLQLRQHPQKARAVDYLKKRGLSGEIARDFGLGYAPPGWDNVLKALAGDDANKRKLLLEAGMLIENPDNQRNPLYDRFRDRIMYPIRDSRGRVIGFGGRVLGDEKPKYLNSPETPVFRKGEELYGLYEARKKLRHPERFMIVEGYMDVIALAQNGIHYSVATLGTATSAAHLRVLFKLVPEVVFCFDGDNAGREAAWRALQQALPVMEDGRSARFLFLPEGQDPDTQVRAIGATAFEASLAKAMGLADFFFETLAARINTDTLEGKAQLSKQAQPFLEKLPKGVYRQLMFDQLAKLTGVRSTKATPSEPPPAAPPTDAPPYSGGVQFSSRPTRSGARPKIDWSPCMRLVNLLIRKPDIIKEVQIPDELGEIRSPDMDLLLQVLELARAWPDSTTEDLMSRVYATSYGGQVTELFGKEHITPTEGMLEEFRDILRRLLDEYRARTARHATLEHLRRLHAQATPTTPGQLPES
ncbi:MAG TPA: DNA primase [Candidatus Acidoferrum sp.]|nr:DNA primase [Candidatus Acidoferrum sp.]